MDNLIKLNQLKDNIIEFDVSVEGTQVDEIEVRLVIETKQYDISFSAEKKSGDSWRVVVPAMPMLERTAYGFHVAVIADGYYFKALKGVANITGTADVYITIGKKVPSKPEIEVDSVEVIKKDKAEDQQPVTVKKPEPEKKPEPAKELIKLDTKKEDPEKKKADDRPLLFKTKSDSGQDQEKKSANTKIRRIEIQDEEEVVKKTKVPEKNDKEPEEKKPVRSEAIKEMFRFLGTEIPESFGQTKTESPVVQENEAKNDLSHLIKDISQIPNKKEPTKPLIRRVG